MENENLVRLNKYLADLNICSRRVADTLIKEGRIIINGECERNPGRRVDPLVDKVVCDFDVEAFKGRNVYIKLNKPVGYVVSTSKDEGRNIYELVTNAGRVYPLGRLDKDSSGLLLLTNDSTLPKIIIGEESHCEKEYFVRVAEAIPDGALEKLRSGVKLWGIRTKPATIRRESENSFFITLVEGKNRQIRRVCQKVGYPVIHLNRIRIHEITLGDLPSGMWVNLTEVEVAALKSLRTL